MNIQNVFRNSKKIADICYRNTTICLQYFTVWLHSNRFVYLFAPLGTSRKTNQNMIWELDFLKLKIVTLCLYRQVYRRKAKILFFSNIYKLFRFLQYSSKYHELNMVKHLKTMNAWWFFCLFMTVARILVQIKNISILRLCMHYKCII